MRELIRKQEDAIGLVIEGVRYEDQYISVCTSDNRAILFEVKWYQGWCTPTVITSKRPVISLTSDIAYALGLTTEEERYAKAKEEDDSMKRYHLQQERETYERLKKKFEEEQGDTNAENNKSV